jgi:hypothetical protein
MPILAASLRYDHLRITIPAEEAGPAMINQMQMEFVELLEAAAGCEMVIVDLPDVRRISPEMTQMLQTWQRIVVLANRKFRINGLSRTVHQVLSPRSRRFSSGETLSFSRSRLAYAESHESASL